MGFVRMEALVKVHPLYPQLAQLDEDVQALQLKSVGPDIARSAADLPREERALQADLDRASAQTRRALETERKDYAAREQAAIDAALRGAGSANGPSGASIAGGVAAEARAQSARASAAAESNFRAYRQQLIDQDKLAVATLNRTYTERATREYRTRAEAFTRKEADYALQLASEDASERLSLRTRLSNLALDDASRADVKGRLDALDRKEADAVGAMKNRDEAALVAYRKDLHDRVGRELASQVAQLQKRTVAKIDASAVRARTDLGAQLAQLPGAAGGAATANVPPDMRARLEALHRRFQAGFDRDAQSTIERFRKTRAELTARFRDLAGIDARAQAGANKQIEQLQKQRVDLYGEMVAQIDREVRAVAQKRGVDVVVREVMAPAGGVDLTDDARKDIESLHE